MDSRNYEYCWKLSNCSGDKFGVYTIVNGETKNGRNVYEKVT